MSVTLTKVKALKPDVLVISGHEKGALTAVGQIEALLVDVPMLALTHCDSAQVAEKLGKAAEYVFCAHQWHRSLAYKDELFGSAEDFAKAVRGDLSTTSRRIRRRSRRRRAVFADALQARAERSIRRRCATRSPRPTSMTFYGPVKFDETGKNIAKPMVLYQIQDGQYVVVAPAEWAAGKPVMPTPDLGERRRRLSSGAVVSIRAGLERLSPRAGASAGDEPTFRFCSRRPLSAPAADRRPPGRRHFRAGRLRHGAGLGRDEHHQCRQGELVMLGGYVTLLLYQAGLSPFLGIPAAAVVMSLGWILFRAVILHLSTATCSSRCSPPSASAS